MKNESEGKIIVEFVGLKSKIYSMKNIDGKEPITEKGVNIATEFNEFKDMLFNKKITRHKMRGIQGKNIKWEHTKSTKYRYLFLIIKRFFLDDGIHTLAYFHKDLKNRLTQMIINKKDLKRFSQMITHKNKCVQTNS